MMKKTDLHKGKLNTKQRLLSLGMVLLCIIFALLLAAFITVSSVVLESHTYKHAAKNDAYLTGIENDVAKIMDTAAKENGLSKTMLMRHAQKKDIDRLAKRNAADAALILKGSQVIYGDSFNINALNTDIYRFFEQHLPEQESPETRLPEEQADATPEAIADAGTSIQKIEAGETAPRLGTSQDIQDPERDALRELSGKLAKDISTKIDSAVRVIDMEQVVYEPANKTFIDWFRFMGRGGVLLPILLLAFALLVLYRLTWEKGFSPWLACVSICTGILLLLCGFAVPAAGLLDLSVEPVQLNILYGTLARNIMTELIVTAVLWFAAGYFAVRAAIGKPVSTKWLHSVLSRFRKNSDGTVSPAEDGSSLKETIKKAAADSTNSLLGRKR